MTSACFRLLAVLAALALSAPSASADEAEGLRRALSWSKGRLAAVEFTARVTLEGLPGMNPADNERNIRGVTAGLVAAKGDAQYVIVSATALTPATEVFEILGARPRMRLTRLAVDTGGGVFLGARLVNTNLDLGLSLLRLDKPADTLSPIDFGAAATAQVGEPVAVVHFGAATLGRPRLVRSARIAGTATRPGPRQLLDPALPTANGALALTLGAEPQLLGIHAALPLASMPSELGGVGRRSFEAAEVEAAAAGGIVPAAAIAAWLAEAREEATDNPGRDRFKLAWIGVETQVITPALATALGLDFDGVAKVQKVYPDTPAAKAGITTGDLICEVDGESIDMIEGETMRDVIGDFGAGEEVELTIQRGEERLRLTITLAESPTPPSAAPRLPAFSHGFILRDRTFFDADAPEGDGLIVDKVEARGPALLAGLKAGDLITAIDGQAVASVAQAQGLIKESRSLTVTLKRPGQDTPLELRVQAKEP